MTDRHPSVSGIVRWLEPNPNLTGDQRMIADACYKHVHTILALIPKDDPELTAGLRKLLEAKDCFVRASMV